MAGQKRARQDQAGLETTAQDVVARRMLARPLAQSGEVAMRTRREGAVQDQTWVTSNPRELQGSRGTQSRLDRGAAQRKSPSPASSSQWPALISAVSVVHPSARFSLCLLRLLWLLLSGPRRPLCGVSLPFSSKLWWVVCAHPPGPPPPSRPQSLVNTVVSSPVACLLYCVSLPCHPARLSLSLGSVHSVPAQSRSDPMQSRFNPASQS